MSICAQSLRLDREYAQIWDCLGTQMRQNPLPIEQFPEIYRDNLGILVTAALGLPH